MKIRTRLTLYYLLTTTLLVGFVFFILEELLFPEAGYDMFHILDFKLILVWVVSFTVLFIIGYLMARSALKPVQIIISQVEEINVSNLNKRVEIKNEQDEIGELASSFNDTLYRLEKSFQDQKIFISNLSHELQTPMAALIAELELSLHKERSKEDYKTVVVNALSDARNIEKLSNGLMNLAKANYSADQITMSNVRIDEVLLDATTLVVKANPNYTVDFSFVDETDDDNMVTIYGNEYLLRMAFVNLIENNCKFSDDNHSNIQILFIDCNVSIRFSDNGIGIDSTEIDNIFKPFYRGNNRHFAQGNGIGMTLVKRIVDIHKGAINVKSTIGKGTTFILSFEHMVIQ